MKIKTKKIDFSRNEKPYLIQPTIRANEMPKRKSLKVNPKKKTPLIF